MTGSSSTASTPFQGYVKIDIGDDNHVKEDIYMPSKHEFLGEPLFVKRQHSKGMDGYIILYTSYENVIIVYINSDEDDGYIISLLFDGHSEVSSLVVFDAKHISKGPVYKVPIEGANIPLGLHSSFAYGYTI
jgi:carotenoid cleavage dioxygenase-like enzyme